MLGLEYGLHEILSGLRVCVVFGGGIIEAQTVILAGPAHPEKAIFVTGPLPSLACPPVCST